jgi:hypothetical protein
LVKQTGSCSGAGPDLQAFVKEVLKFCLPSGGRLPIHSKLELDAPHHVPRGQLCSLELGEQLQ